MMKQSLMTGFSFGLTSGVITPLGLMVGLNAGTHSRLAVIGGIVTIAVADALSDALGIHVAEESKNNGSVSEVWESTIAALLAKFLTALTFVVPVLLLAYTPLRGPLGFVPLPPLFLAALLCIVVGYVVAAEVAKKVFYRHV